MAKEEENLKQRRKVSRLRDSNTRFFDIASKLRRSKFLVMMSPKPQAGLNLKSIASDISNICSVILAAPTQLSPSPSQKVVSEIMNEWLVQIPLEEEVKSDSYIPSTLESHQCLTDSPLNSLGSSGQI